jgi:hypothetical protein
LKVLPQLEKVQLLRVKVLQLEKVQLELRREMLRVKVRLKQFCKMQVQVL